MISKLKLTLKGINYRLFLSLIVMALCPSIYTTIRIFYMGEFPDEWAYSIAGQLAWVNLIYEVINEAIILPLFYFMGKSLLEKKEFTNKIKTGLIFSGALYFVLSLIIIIFAEPLVELMAVDKNIIQESVNYIRLESVANVFGILSQFVFVALVTLGKDRYVYVLTGVKLLLVMILDCFLVSRLPFSLNLGVNGIAISNIIVNSLLFIITIIILANLGYNIFNREKLDFHWCKDFFKIGGISGLESLIRNLFYVLMISRMVNVVGEMGVYWVANHFIWGWLLLPILQLSELIKQQVATDENHIQNNTLGYILITLGICLIWFILVPLFKPFFKYVLNFDQVDKLFKVVMVLIGFYVLFAIQNVFDSIFYGLGKTSYMLCESIITNSVYYGICFILYSCSVFKPSLLTIDLMFGVGLAFDSIVSFIAFLYLCRKEKIKLFNFKRNEA